MGRALCSGGPVHEAARKWLRENRDRLVTSDYVVDELLTVLKTRFSAQASVRGGQSLFGEHFSQLVYLTFEDIERAWKVFRRTPTSVGVSRIAPAWR